ncbi:HAMP domain-containing sensor histidine kinase [Caulobacter segnis]|uniref:sensor histidine kinase n=1 Tax=Caulobacter segnis TaxID=88688 RepID=UPI00286A3ADD|nr:HAMP domain-containing sensor histidine kinase [Caulobacter segnis]
MTRRTLMRLSRRLGGPSLMRMLVPLVLLAVAATILFAMANGDTPEEHAMSMLQRMQPARLLAETTDSATEILLLVSLIMVGVYLTLHIGLRPLRRLSRLAGGIGPATIDARLPVESAPREVAPLVEAFNAALDRLETGLRAQRDFSANAAHELRTPLATLRAQVESLLEPSERQAASEEFERLGRLIAQLLALAEAEGGALGANTRFDLVALSRDVASDMASFILSSGRTLGFDSAVQALTLDGQAGLVGTALRNLLENAVRHTPPGAEILVAVTADAVVRVSDDGPGVSAEIRDRVFERFSRGSPSGAGAGLGLSIVRQIMERHGGVARLTSVERGACFELDFRPQGHRGDQSVAQVPAGGNRTAM